MRITAHGQSGRKVMRMDEMTFTLHNPLTEEEWDIIEDVDFDHTNSITFHTKHGKDVEFVKRKTGRWIDRNDNVATCSVCGNRWGLYRLLNYCPNCGAKME